MFEFELTPELIVLVLAGITSFVFDYFPKVAAQFDALDEAGKRRVVFVALFGIVAVVFLGDCFNVFTTYLTCTAMGAIEAISLLLKAVAVNQGVHGLTKPSAAYKAKILAKA